MSSQCIRCGMCCHDWKGGDEAGRCEHLAADSRTCTAWDILDEPEINRGSCRNSMTPAQASSLPDTCGYMIYWREQGLL